MEESGKHSEQELDVLWEKFCINETDIGAKYLWLQYTLSNLSVPDNVLGKMIEIIEYDIQSYEDNHTSYGALSKRETEEPIFKLLGLAINNPNDFWEILHAPDNNILLVSQFDEDLLEKTRLKFPRKRKLKPGELYDFFGRQLDIKEDDSEYTSSIEEKMRNRNRKTYIKNKTAEELLFK